MSGLCGSLESQRGLPHAVWWIFLPSYSYGWTACLLCTSDIKQLSIALTELIPTPTCEEEARDSRLVTNTWLCAHSIF